MGNLVCKQRRHGIADLVVLLCTISLEEIVVWECLQSSCLSYREAATLPRVRVNEVVAVFGDVASHGRTRCLL